MMRSGLYAPILTAFLTATAYLAPTQAWADDARIVEKPYDSREVVRIDARARIQATIEFADGEQIENVAIGDSQAWQITPNKRANLLFVKPMAASAATNMTVVTDRHTYLFDLVANATSRPVYVLRFTYPEEAVSAATPAVPVDQLAEVPPAAPMTPYSIVDPARLNFAWQIRGDKALAPQRIYDDGLATFLTWPTGHTLPAILVKNPQGQEGPVNFAARDDMIVVEGVPPEIVLRSGKKSALLVQSGQPRKRSEQISALADFTDEKGHR